MAARPEKRRPRKIPAATSLRMTTDCLARDERHNAGLGADPRATPAHGAPTRKDPRARGASALTCAFATGGGRPGLQKETRPLRGREGRGTRAGLDNAYPPIQPQTKSRFLTPIRTKRDWVRNDNGFEPRGGKASGLACEKAQARPELQGKPALREDAKDGAPAQDTGPRHGPTRNTGAWATHKSKSKPKADPSASPPQHAQKRRGPGTPVGPRDDSGLPGAR